VAKIEDPRILAQFVTPLGKSYFCPSPNVLDLTDQKSGDKTVIVRLSNVQMQAFDITAGKFSPGKLRFLFAAKTFFEMVKLTPLFPLPCRLQWFTVEWWASLPVCRLRSECSRESRMECKWWSSPSPFSARYSRFWVTLFTEVGLSNESITERWFSNNRQLIKLSNHVFHLKNLNEKRLICPFPLHNVLLNKLKSFNLVKELPKTMSFKCIGLQAPIIVF
jgi:hypothetical protein